MYSTNKELVSVLSWILQCNHKKMYMKVLQNAAFSHFYMSECENNGYCLGLSHCGHFIKQMLTSISVFTLQPSTAATKCCKHQHPAQVRGEKASRLSRVLDRPVSLWLNTVMVCAATVCIVKGYSLGTCRDDSFSPAEVIAASSSFSLKHTWERKKKQQTAKSISYWQVILSSVLCLIRSNMMRRTIIDFWKDAESCKSEQRRGEITGKRISIQEGSEILERLIRSGAKVLITLELYIWSKYNHKLNCFTGIVLAIRGHLICKQCV